MNTVAQKVTTETEIVCSKDNKHTYLLIKRLVGVKGASATIILLYPTRNRDNIFSEDSTLNHLINHMQELGLNELRVINLFSQVVEGKLSAKGLAVDEENIKYIDSLMADKSFKDNKFIIAWGSSMSTSYACNKAKTEVLNLFRKHCPRTKAYQIVSENLDFSTLFAHPLFLGIRSGNEKWSLDEVNITSKMLVEPEKKKK